MTSVEMDINPMTNTESKNEKLIDEDDQKLVLESEKKSGSLPDRDVEKNEMVQREVMATNGEPKASCSKQSEDVMVLLEKVDTTEDQKAVDVELPSFCANKSEELVKQSLRDIVTDKIDGKGSESFLENRQIEPSIPIDKGNQESLIKKVNKMAISEVPQKLSEVILKNPSESLRHLLVYENSTDEEEGEDDVETSSNFDKNWQMFAIQDEDQSSSDSESDSNESLDDTGDSDTDGTSIECVEVIDQTNKKKTTEKVSKIDDDYIEDLVEPAIDISGLKISYDKEEFLLIGHIKAIIDTIVTVEAIPGTAAYDLDSILFIENLDSSNKRVLGAIFDVIGPVTSPIYCIRFKSHADIEAISVKTGDKVFSAPKSEYTRYVFMKELMKLRGTDASWVGDKELPEELVDISDDEKEAILEEIRQSSTQPKKRKHGSLERHQRFEKNMNKYNTMNSKVYQIVDTHNRMERGFDNCYASSGAPTTRMQFGGFPPTFAMPHFDPSVPPPGFHNDGPSNWCGVTAGTGRGRGGGATSTSNNDVASSTSWLRNLYGAPEPRGVTTYSVVGGEWGIPSATSPALPLPQQGQHQQAGPIRYRPTSSNRASRSSGNKRHHHFPSQWTHHQ